eukprot:TRINITY_DN9633_c0_g1_i2.p1 TRINITY_DN9633_c0_g1~~TRINITY_DN9633_c0_g1_i2.p1  ORF type:complete len:354 (-),score=92.02 TRINITY_DN9633_c0_g1_i2:32-1063(-)
MSIAAIIITVLVIARSAVSEDSHLSIPDLISFQNAPTNLYPEGFVHDVRNNRFLISSLAYGSLSTLSYTGVVEHVAAPFDSELAMSGLGLEIDYARNRVVFVACNMQTGASGIVAFDLTTWKLLFVSYPPGAPAFDDVAFDKEGNAYVTGLFRGEVFKVTTSGEISLFTTIPPSYPEVDFSLNGIVSVEHAGRAYLVVGSLNTIRSAPFPFPHPSSFYKVSLLDGSYEQIAVAGGASIFGADGMQISKDRNDIYVVTTDRLFKLTSRDDWNSARLAAGAEIKSPENNNPGSTAGDFVGNDFYVVEGYLKELVTTGPQGRTAYWATKVVVHERQADEQDGHDEL